jgi:hypothetical protein
MTMALGKEFSKKLKLCQVPRPAALGKEFKKIKTLPSDVSGWHLVKIFFKKN